ncbi:MAG TPA: nucleoside-diphosphate sugar epimerase/dehydratase [Pirellulales bacterium]|nr:nucleoside-diphosphate sugar epimerase/dehydratase [Pirellulales bacterium]
MFDGAIVLKRRLLRNLLRLSVLAPLFIAVYYVAYWLRFGPFLDRPQTRVFTATLAWIVAVKLAFFGLFHVYRHWSRHVTLQELLAIIKAAAGSTAAICLIDQLQSSQPAIPICVLLLDLSGTILTVSGLRVALRLVRERLGSRPPSEKIIRTFIAGVDSSSEALLRILRYSSQLKYQVLGFLDCSSQHVGMRVDGIPVRGTLDETQLLVHQHAVKEVLIVAGALSGRQVRQLIEDCQNDQVRVTVLPSYEQLLTGHVSFQPRPVSIEDLLRREPVELDLQHISQFIDNRVILVTGSAGSIGTEICRQLLNFSPSKLVLVDRWENGQFYLERELIVKHSACPIEICVADITDRRRMRALLAQHRPEIIFHAAAYKHVPLMESNPGEAVKNIVLATSELADLADEFAVDSFVMISSDKAVRPSSIMGACKRTAELYLQAVAKNSACRFITVRFGNVLDSAGSVVPIFREQISRGGPVTVTDPAMQRFFMTIPEASQLVIQAAAIGQAHEIFALDMGEPVQIVDLAADMIRLSGLRLGEDIEIEFTGVRPGEKLFEELHSYGEQHLPTRHPKIMVASQEPVDADAVVAAVERLAAITEEPFAAIAAELGKLIPEFHFPKPAQLRLAA